MTDTIHKRMTIINRMIKQAHSCPKPVELLLPRHRVRRVAEHIRLSMLFTRVSIDEIEQMIVDGKLKLLGIPVRVIGSKEPKQ